MPRQGYGGLLRRRSRVRVPPPPPKRLVKTKKSFLKIWPTNNGRERHDKSAEPLHSKHTSTSRQTYSSTVLLLQYRRLTYCPLINTGPHKNKGNAICIRNQLNEGVDNCCLTIIRRSGSASFIEVVLEEIHTNTQFCGAG